MTLLVPKSRTWASLLPRSTGFALASSRRRSSPLVASPLLGIGALGRRHDSQGAMRERHGRGLLTRTRALVMQNIVGRFARTLS